MAYLIIKWPLCFVSLTFVLHLLVQARNVGNVQNINVVAGLNTGKDSQEGVVGSQANGTVK